MFKIGALSIQLRVLKRTDLLPGKLRLRITAGVEDANQRLSEGRID